MLLRLNGITAGILIGLLGMLVLLLPPVSRMEHDLGLDWLFKWRGDRAASEHVLVAAMDRESSDALGYQNIPRKWQRKTHSILVKSLSDSGVRAIGFDVLFSEARDSEQDRQLANTLKQAGNVVLFENLFTINQQDYRMERLEPPIEILAKAALDVAPFALPKVPAKVSQVWLFKTGAGDQPTLPMVLLHVYLHPHLEDFSALLRQAFTDLREPSPDWLLKKAIPTRPGEQASQFRRLFHDHPELASAITARLADIQPEQTRQALTSWVYALTRGDSMVLNLYGPARSIETLPIHKLLTPTPDSLKGKAVFVGFSEILQPEQQDGFYTSFTDEDGVDISGVELMATTFSNLLQRESIRPLNGHEKWLTVFAAGLVIGLLLFLASGIFSVGMAILLAFGWAYLALLLFENLLLWIPLTTVLLIQLPAALLLAMIWHYSHSRHSKLQITDEFKRFIPADVVNHLDQTGQLTQGEVLPAICLFTDMESYTPLGEQLDPESLQTLLNQYFSDIQVPILEYGGKVQDMTGDSMLSLWTGKQLNPSNVCRAALAIQSRQTQLKAGTRIGIHRGDIYLGIMGSQNHAEYRPVGDVINTAKRLESLNKLLGTTILATADVVHEATDISARRLGKFPLKGKRDDVEVFEIRGLSSATSPLEQAFIQRFEKGLINFESGDIQSACQIFSDLLEQQGDLVSQHYVTKCQNFPFIHHI